MKVKAKRLGYYNHKRVGEGQKFHLREDSDFSHEWMEAESDADRKKVRDLLVEKLKKAGKAIPAELLAEPKKEEAKQVSRKPAKKVVKESDKDVI